MSPGVATFIAVLFIGYLVLGLTGNFLTILALLRCPRVRNVTAAFIIRYWNVAVSLLSIAMITINR
ncbi:G-protein coupled receptor moody [Portunus trituberculatus]|uniref:G-protein coupled receptor moody n=2 Tax=Portuninae TaxID=600346 RepID=A0A5B7I035_PORTR|nr:G-protein coupled receptor moody [Portunus trituberculatus]